jgi:HD superfamily phosphohydrolase
VILRDPVHGLIRFGGPEAGADEAVERLVLRLLDTPEVQRLRRIRALGLASLAFPGGEHSRFAHAVGSAHVMSRYLRRVRELDADLAASDRVDSHSAAAAMAAALLHDLGHGPYSHTFEELSPDAPRHESWTSAVILDPSTGVFRVLADFDPALPKEVEGLVFGRHRVAHLARAVSGTFDVDRCDYLMRDSHMTGVRYGLFDLDWLLASLRLWTPTGTPTGAGGPAVLAVDGEKGLTAVEGFFLTRVYMYRQVYLHKAVRAAEVVMHALFERLRQVGPVDGTPPAFTRLLRGEAPSLGEYLDLDDRALDTAIHAWARGDDPLLAELASRLRERRLFKTMSLRTTTAEPEAHARLAEVLQSHGLDPSIHGAIDRVGVDAYAPKEGEDLHVLHASGRVERLVDASPVLHGLQRESIEHVRAVFPAEVRDAVQRALADFA